MGFWRDRGKDSGISSPNMGNGALLVNLLSRELFTMFPFHLRYFKRKAAEKKKVTRCEKGDEEEIEEEDDLSKCNIIFQQQQRRRHDYHHFC